jgi:hypothetical protein
MKVRVSRRVISDLEGSQAWYEVDIPFSREHPDDLSLIRKIRAAPSRKDGSCTVDLTEGELNALYMRADWLMDKSRDGISFGDRDALADYNAGRGLANQIERLRRGAQ